LTCPNCEYRFYILEEETGKGFEWFCPRCQHRFTEADAAALAAARTADDGAGDRTRAKAG
jgi:uncharacterized Zn finger protein (UPF0148 family)